MHTYDMIIKTISLAIRPAADHFTHFSSLVKERFPALYCCVLDSRLLSNLIHKNIRASGPVRTRTAYLFIANEAFYQVNYGPERDSPETKKLLCIEKLLISCAVYYHDNYMEVSIGRYLLVISGMNKIETPIYF